jgi:hypothetical protein
MHGYTAIMATLPLGVEKVYNERTAAGAVGQLAKQLEGVTLLGIGGYDEDLPQTIWEGLANPKLPELIELAPEGYTSPYYKDLRNQAEKYLRSDSDSLVNRYRVAIEGATLPLIPDSDVRLNQVTLVNLDKLDEGIVTFELDEKEVRKSWPKTDGIDVQVPGFINAIASTFGFKDSLDARANELEIELNRSIGGLDTRNVNRNIAYAQAALEELGKQASEQIRVQALLDAEKYQGINYEEAANNSKILVPFTTVVGAASE